MYMFVSASLTLFPSTVQVGTLLKLEAKCTYTPDFPRKTYMITVTATMQIPGVSVEKIEKRSRSLGKYVSRPSSIVPPNPAPESTSSNPNIAPVTAPVQSAGGVSSDSRLTNEFHFVFHCDKPEMIPRVFPRTYDDAMQWISAHRRLTHGSKLAEARGRRGGAIGRFNEL